jgi:hypothetical protein
LLLKFAPLKDFALPKEYFVLQIASSCDESRENLQAVMPDNPLDKRLPASNHPVTDS